MKSENLFHQSSSVIFMLHRVGNRDTSRLEPNESMKVSAAFFYLRDQLLSSESTKHTRAFSWLSEQKAISSLQ
jgi:hypothetical protein